MTEKMDQTENSNDVLGLSHGPYFAGFLLFLLMYYHINFQLKRIILEVFSYPKIMIIIIMNELIVTIIIIKNTFD